MEMKRRNTESYSALSFWILFFFSFIEILSGQRKSYFVSPAGDDRNSGLSFSSPFSSINKAVNFAAPGDTVFLLPGTFKETVQLVGKKGAPEKPVCIFGYSMDPAQRPFIDGGASAPSLNASNYWMNIQNSEWVEIGNINFKNGWTDPITISNSSYITFDGCYFYGGRKAVAASGALTHHLLVQNCYWDQGGSYLWFYNEPAGIDAAWAKMHDGSMQYYNGSFINFSGTGGSIVIRNNTIINAFNGIRWNGAINYDSNIEIYNNTVMNVRDNDFEPEYYTFNLHIHNNNSHNIHKTMSIDHVNGGNIYYWGNQITSDKDSWSNSISSAFWKVYGDASGNLTLPMYAFNNSFCGVGKAFAMDSGTKAVLLNHFNNAYYFTGSRGWLLDSWDTTDHFDYDISNKDWPGNIKNNSQESHGKYTDVKFADVINFDLRLQQTSPAIDAGKVISFPELGWSQSFSGSAPDIGAFEGDQPIDGPVFRFRNAPGLNISYKEKPRIVKSKVTGNILDLFFSDILDPATAANSDIILREKGIAVDISNLLILNDNYLMELETSKNLSEKDLTIEFRNFPRGMNGENVTLWGSTLASYKKDILLNVNESGFVKENEIKPELKIYPNPFNNQTKILISLPENLRNESRMSINIYDLLGRKIQEIKFNSGNANTSLHFDASSLASGIYFAVLSVNKSTISQKLIVMK